MIKENKHRNKVNDYNLSLNPMIEVYKTLCTIEAPYIFIKTGPYKEDLLYIDEINTYRNFPSGYSNNMGMEIPTGFEDIIELQLLKFMNNDVFKIKKDIKYVKSPVQEKLTAVEVLEKSSIRIPTLKELEELDRVDVISGQTESRKMNSNHIINEFSETIDSYNLFYDYGFSWSLSCYENETEEDTEKYMEKESVEDIEIKTRNEQDFITYDLVRNCINPITKKPLIDEKNDTFTRYYAFRNNGFDYDADSSFEAVTMYKIIYTDILENRQYVIRPQSDEYNKYGMKYEIAENACQGELSFRGDTINTVATTNRAYCLNHNKKWDEIYWPKEALEFMDLYHTPGNFWILPYTKGMSVNCKRGVGAAKDYFDLFLLAIYNFYESVGLKESRYENIDISRVLDDNYRTVSFFKGYLLDFYEKESNKDYDSQINPNGISEIKNYSGNMNVRGWTEFVNSYFLQDYVEIDKKGIYGAPKELWEGHFDFFNRENDPFPERESQFIEFWTNASELIRNRGSRIYHILNK